MAASDANALRAALTSGLVIPAHPLALTAERRLDERRQAALARYYFAAGTGGIAVGVHSTQFEIRDPQHKLFKPVLELAAATIGSELLATPRDYAMIAGHLRPDRPGRRRGGAGALASATTPALVSMAAYKTEPEAAILAHVATVAKVIPVIGFYLQPAVGGRVFSYAFWQKFAGIPEESSPSRSRRSTATRPIDVVRAAASGRAEDMALYTGNDDAIVADLPRRHLRLRRPEGPAPVRIVGGLLGQWGVWTHGRGAPPAEGCRRAGDEGAWLWPSANAHRRQRRALRRRQRLRRLHRRDPRGPAPAGAARRRLPRPAGRPLARSGRGDRPGDRGLPRAHGRRVRGRAPRRVAPRTPRPRPEAGRAPGHLVGLLGEPVVLGAAMEQAPEGGSVLVESTSNQVNPEGGYTGQTPADFARASARTPRRASRPTASSSAATTSAPPLAERARGGGPWPSARAGPPVRARRLREDPPRREHGLRRRSRGAGLPSATVAARTADLRRVAEAAAGRAGRRPPVYVVGTEVPRPGASRRARRAGHARDAARRFLDPRARAAFAARGLEDAWERVIALVVQPGVEFGDDVVFRLRARGRAGLRSTEVPAARVRGPLHRLPDAEGSARPRPRPLRDPQGRARADLRVPRGGVRPRGVEQRVARRTRRPLDPAAARRSSEAMLADPAPGASTTTATPTRRPRFPAFSLSDRMPLLLAGPRGPGGARPPASRTSAPRCPRRAPQPVPARARHRRGRPG